MKKRTLSVLVTLALVLGFTFVALIGSSPSSNEDEVIQHLQDQIVETHAEIASAETAEDKDNILWLARVVYSETKRENEMPSIAWVVRNRVETGYMGETYQEVATHPYQFSGLNSFDNHYQHNITRDWTSGGQKWKAAVEIARKVYQSHGFERPFPKTVRHFYSPVAVSSPHWAENARPIKQIRSEIDPAYVRFAFYDQIQ